jgi:hypothetical protein
VHMQKQGKAVLLLPGTARAHAQCFSARHAVLLNVVTPASEQRKRVHATWAASCLSVFILGHRPEITAHSNVLHRTKQRSLHCSVYVRKKLEELLTRY